MKNNPRNFFYFLCSSALSLLSVEIFHLAVPLTVLALGYSAIEAGWCTFAFFSPVILGKLLAGPLIEARSKKTTLLQSEAGRTLVILLYLACLLLFSANHIVFIILLSFIFGLFSTFTDIAEPAALKLLIAKDNANSVLTRYEVRTRSVQLVGPAICGLLIAVGLPAPYAFALLLSLCALFLIRRIALTEELHCGLQEEGILASLASALNWVRPQKLFIIMVLLTALNNFIHPILYLTVIYQVTRMDVGVEFTGLVLSGLGVGGIVGSIISSFLAKKFRLRTLVLAINTLRILVFAGFILFPTPQGMFLFFVFKAVLGGVWNVCYNVYTIQTIPQSHISRVASLSGLIIKCSTAAGSLIAGYLISFAGVQPTLILLVACTIVMLLCSLPYRTYYPQR